MTEYLLDTNHISPLVTHGHPLRLRILAQLQAGDQFSIATPALHEFLFGITSIPRATENLQTWVSLKGLFKYYHVDQIAAEQSAQLRIILRRQGQQLEAIDSFIAVIAARYDVILLTIFLRNGSGFLIVHAIRGGF